MSSRSRIPDHAGAVPTTAPPQHVPDDHGHAPTDVCAPLSAEDVLAIQRTAGNRAATAIVQRDDTKTATTDPAPLKPLGSVTTLTDLAVLTPADVKGFGLTGKVKQAASDDRARPLLTAALGNNWFFAKDVLLKGEGLPKGQFDAHKDDVYGALMDGLLGLRERQYTRLLSDIQTKHLTDVVDPTTEDGTPVPLANRLNWSAAGSATRTSDIDVNLKGLASIRAVSLFNDLFKSELGYPFEPGTVFDVNVYAKDVMVGETGKPGASNPMRGVRQVGSGAKASKHKGQHVEIVPNQEVELEGLDYEKFVADQEVWALVHTRRYMTAAEWVKYRDDLTKGGGDTSLAEKMLLAEVRYAEYQRNLEEKQQQIRDMADAASRSWGPLQAILKKGEEASSYERGAAEMLVANQVYGEKLVRVQQLRDEIEAARGGLKGGRAIAAIGLELKTAISAALMYANEVYVTQGAIHHAVIGTQIGRGMAKKVSDQAPEEVLSEDERSALDFASVGIALPKELFMHAFEENVGDFLKATLGSHHAAGSTAATRMAADLSHGGKYLDRLGEAAGKLGITTKEIPHLDALHTLGSGFAVLKAQSEADPTINAGVVAAETHGGALLGSDLRSVVIGVSVAVRHAYQATLGRGGGGSLSVPLAGQAPPTSAGPGGDPAQVRSMVQVIEESIRRAAAEVPVIPAGRR